MHSETAANKVLEKTTGAISTSSHVVDNELSFRALDGFDSMGRDPSCGFDVKALEMLFPEEMGAYQRWKKVRCLLFFACSVLNMINLIVFFLINRRCMKHTHKTVETKPKVKRLLTQVMIMQQAITILRLQNGTQQT
jgi:hypothetical protein